MSETIKTVLKSGKTKIIKKYKRTKRGGDIGEDSDDNSTKYKIIIGDYVKLLVQYLNYLENRGASVPKFYYPKSKGIIKLMKLVVYLQRHKLFDFTTPSGVDTFVRAFSRNMARQQSCEVRGNVSRARNPKDVLEDIHCIIFDERNIIYKDRLVNSKQVKDEGVGVGILYVDGIPPPVFTKERYGVHFSTAIAGCKKPEKPENKK